MAASPWRAWDGLDGTLFQLSTTDTGYTLRVSDLARLQSESLDGADFCYRLRQLNPSLEATPAQILPLLAAAVGSGDCGAAWDGDVITLNGQVSGVPLRWEFLLETHGADQLARQLLRPLLVALGQTHERERQLMEAVKARDLELDDYRRSGAHLTLRRLRTEPLSDAQFEADMSARGLCPGALVAPSAWKTIRMEAEQAKVAEVGDGADRHEAPTEPAPSEDLETMAARRKKELTERLAMEARQAELAKKNKRKRLKL